MVKFMNQFIFFISFYFIKQKNQVKSQFVDYGSFYVHHTPSPIQGYPAGPPQLPGPYGHIPWQPVYTDVPPPYQGVEQAHALRAAYPNQPIIIINNGGNDDSDNKKNNGLGLNFGDLAAIFLASKHHSGLGGYGELPPPIPAPPVTPHETYVSTESQDKESSNSKGSTVHITIVLPSSGSVSVEAENKKKKKKKPKEVEKPKEVVEEDDEEEEEI